MKQHPVPYFQMLLPLAVALSLLFLMLTLSLLLPDAFAAAPVITSFTVDSSTAITAIVDAGSGNQSYRDRFS